jgi:hypothetical protein
MTISTVKSEAVTNIESNPITALDRKTGTLTSIVDQDAIPTTSLDETGDKMLFCPIPSNAVILDVLLLNDDLDSAGPALAADIGLYYSGIGGTQYLNGNTSGVVVDADCFTSAGTTLQAAVTTWTSVRYEAANITTADQEAWEIAGLAADPGGLFYVGITVTTPATTAAAGDIVVRVDYI